MDLERDDFFGPFGVAGTFGAFLLIAGLILLLYALAGIEEYNSLLGQLNRLFNPDAQAEFRNLLIILLMGSGVAIFGGLLVITDVYRDS